MTVLSPFTNAPQAQRSLAAVFLFYDVFYAPFDNETPFINSSLLVAIPAQRWSAFRSIGDNTYRLSLTPAYTPPQLVPLEVQVDASDGDYVNHEFIELTLPLTISSPPLRSDFMLVRPLWPTRLFSVPDGETAVIGRVSGAPGLPLNDLKVIIKTGVGPLPSLPYARTDANGEFLYRFPRLPGALSGGTVAATVALSGPGPIVVSPATVTLVLGQTQFLSFKRT